MPVKVWVIFSRDPSTSKKEQSRTCSRLMCVFFNANAFVHFSILLFSSSASLQMHRLFLYLEPWFNVTVNVCMSVWRMITNEYRKSQSFFLFISKLWNFPLWQKFDLFWDLDWLIWLYTSFIHNQGLWRIQYYQ